MVTPDELDDRTGDFARIADSAPVPMWVSRLDRTRRYVNRAYCDFLGLEPAAARAFDWREILHPDDAARVVAESLAGEASLEPFTLEARYRRDDGEWRWHPFDLAAAVRRRRARMSGFVGVAIDLTEAKNAELDLREREQQLSAFIHQTMAGFAQVDLQGRFTARQRPLLRDRGANAGGIAGRDDAIDHASRRPRRQRPAVRSGSGRRHALYARKALRPARRLDRLGQQFGSAIRRPDGELYGILAVSST